jgi:hypothetical protein
MPIKRSQSPATTFTREDFDAMGFAALDRISRELNRGN